MDKEIVDKKIVECLKDCLNNQEELMNECLDNLKDIKKYINIIYDE